MKPTVQFITPGILVSFEDCTYVVYQPTNPSLYFKKLLFFTAVGPVVISEAPAAIIKQTLCLDYPHPVTILVDPLVAPQLKKLGVSFKQPVPSTATACATTADVALNLKSTQMYAWYYFKLKQGLIHKNINRLYNTMRYNPYHE